MKVAFLGDIALIGKYNIKREDIFERIKYLHEILKECDYIIANLESPLTSVKLTTVCKSMHLKSDIENVQILKKLGIDAVSLANNHINDFGKKGLVECKHILEENGIKWFGICNRNYEIVSDKISIRISGFCCYSTNASKYSSDDELYGVRLLNRINIEQQLIRDRAEGYISVLFVHWGDEHTNYPKSEHVELVKSLADEYKFIMIGHHPHVIQGMQNIKQSFVAYSLGNCLFDDCVSINGKMQVKISKENRKSILLICEFEPDGIRNYSVKGFWNGERRIEPLEISDEIQDISNYLISHVGKKKYEIERKRQMQLTLKEKFGKHNLRWLLSRLNYYSIVARIDRNIYNKRFLKESEKFGKKNVKCEGNCNSIRIILPEFGLGCQYIRKSGFEVCNPYIGNKLLFRIFREIHFRLNLPAKWIWYNKKNITNKKVIFVFTSLIKPDYMKWIRKKNPNSKIILFYCDRANTIAALNPNLVDKKFCEKWTVDYEDAQKYNMHYYNGGLYYKSIKVKNQKEIYDVFYVGKDKKRLDKLIKLQTMIEKEGLKTYFHITAERRFQLRRNKLYKTPLKYDEVLEYIGKSRAILHLTSGCQKGITMRIAEALLFEKKLISDDLDLIKRDFYHPNNIFLLGYDNLKNLQKFLNSEYIKMDSDFYRHAYFEDLIYETTGIKC